MIYIKIFAWRFSIHCSSIGTYANSFYQSIIIWPLMIDMQNSIIDVIMNILVKIFTFYSNIYKVFN